MKLDELRERSSTKRETAEDTAKTLEELRATEAQQLRRGFHVGPFPTVLGDFRCGIVGQVSHESF